MHVCSFPDTSVVYLHLFGVTSQICAKYACTHVHRMVAVYEWGSWLVVSVLFIVVKIMQSSLLYVVCVCVCV